MATAAELHKDAVWRGDPKAVAYARAKYQEDPKRYLILLCVALYSARMRPSCSFELVAKRDELLQQKDVLASADFDDYFESNHFDRVDMITTYFAYIAERPELDFSEREKLKTLASKMCQAALDTSELRALKDTDRAHTYYLIATTYAGLHIKTKEAMRWLDLVAEDASTYVTNQKQLARLYCRLGFLYPKTGHYAREFFLGFKFAFKACFVPGLTLLGRGKCVAVLLGFEL
ncbi:MAG: hypothetical protein JWL75_568 [Parcubacteria group bacterium]|nr:hypothetical protein [Parcubacteria group bacterium]